MKLITHTKLQRIGYIPDGVSNADVESNDNFAHPIILDEINLFFGGFSDKEIDDYQTKSKQNLERFIAHKAKTKNH